MISISSFLGVEGALNFGTLTLSGWRGVFGFGPCALELYVFAGWRGLGLGTLPLSGKRGPCTLEPYFFRGRGGIALCNFTFFAGQSGHCALKLR